MSQSTPDPVERNNPFRSDDDERDENLRDDDPVVLPLLGDLDDDRTDRDEPGDRV